MLLYLGASSGILKKNPFSQTTKRSKQMMTEERLIADIQKVIAADGNIDASQNQYKQTYLHIAAKDGFAEAVVLCLNNGANIEAVDYPARMTPLHRAAFDGCAEVVKLLINGGANLEAREMLEGTVLGSAIHAETNRKSIVIMLLAAGAAVDARDKHGKTPLFEAVRKGQLDTVKVLLDNGADITVRDIIGFTPLHQAAYNGQAAIAELLIEHDAELNARDKDGATPLDIAGGEVASLLRSHGAKRGSEL
jgi:ankyrin repeat protein